MRVIVNGAPVDVDHDITVAGLVSRLGFPDKGIAVAVNHAVLPRSQWGAALPDGAHIEVVTAVQGG